MLIHKPATVVLISVLLLAAFLQPAAAGEHGSMLQTDCSRPPEIMAVDDIRTGMTGKSYTTLAGRDISEFDIEVLGVLPGAIYPLIDMILVEVSGPAVEEVGGLAGGFSGSPVYIDGKLIGAIAYGFFGNSFIAGVTPAEAMAELGGFPASQELQSTPAADEALELIEAAVGVLGAPQPLPVPVGIGGVSDRWIEQLQTEIRDRGLPFAMYPASGSTTGGSGSGSPGAILPGESMSAVLSEGDNFAFGTGTATYCDGATVLGWGHPFFWTGGVTMSMNEADVVTVVENATGFGNFKIVTLGEPAGRVDFDGNAGIRAVSGETAPFVPITSSVEFAELGTSRNGETLAYLADDLSFSLGFTAAFHLLTNLDYVSGTGFRPGSSSVAWTVAGTREDGSSFDASFDNKYWDQFSITDASIFELAFFVDQLLFNSFEDIDITSVDVGAAELFSDRRTVAIQDVRVSTTSNPDPVEGFGFVQAIPGDLVTVDVTLRPFTGDEFTQTLQLEIPADFPGGFGSLSVRGGSGDFFFDPFFFDPFFAEPGGPVGDIEDFDGLLQFMEDRDHNYDLVAQLDLFPEGFNGEPPPDEIPEPLPEFIEGNGGPGGGEILTVKDVIELDAVITGGAFFDLEVFPESPFASGTLFAELSGDNVVAGGDADGRGIAELTLEGDTVIFDITLDGVDEPITAAHIHAGEAGEDGPVVVDLNYEFNGLSGVVFADPFLLEEMLVNPEFFYLQVHSEGYPAGAVRGQLAYDVAGEVSIEASTLGYVGAGGLWQVAGHEPFFFGTPGDIPFFGDWDGDGVKTPGLYRPNSGFAYVRNSNDTGFADHSFFVGMRGDIPIVGDWDGDGTDTFGVYRDGTVYLRNSNTTGVADVEYLFGVAGDVPFTGDFDGNGTTDVGLHRAATGLVYMRMSHSSGVADVQFYWGVGGDQVVAGDWDGDGRDTVGLVRPDTGTFYLRNHNSLGMADDEHPLGVVGAQVVVY